MNVTKYPRILSLLGKWALRYQTKVHETVDKDAALYEDALHETGTVDTE